MDIAIDIQGFRDLGEKFIPKEIAVVGIESTIIGHWIITPPCAFEELPESSKQENNWLSQYYHGIEWFDGEADLKRVVTQLREIARRTRHIYTRGAEKAVYLQHILSRNISNLEGISPTFKNLSDYESSGCPLHGFRLRNKFHCALHNACKLKRWLVTRENIAPDSQLKIADFVKKKKKNLTQNIVAWLKNNSLVEETVDKGLAKEHTVQENETNNSKNNAKSFSVSYNTRRQLSFESGSGPATANKKVKNYTTRILQGK